GGLCSNDLAVLIRVYMTKAILFKPFPIYIHVIGWVVYLLWIGGVNVFKYGWSHLWVVLALTPVMLAIFYFNWHALRRLVKNGWNWKGIGLSLLYLLLLLYLGYQVLYGFPNEFSGRILRTPENPMFDVTMYVIEVAGFYWAFAYKGLGLAAAEVLYNLLKVRYVYLTGKRQILEEERQRIGMQRWISHFLGNLNQSLIFAIKKGSASFRVLESYGIIWAFGMRIIASDKGFFIPLDLELYHLQRLRGIYPLKALQVQVSGETRDVQVLPMALLALYKNMYKHGEVQSESDAVFKVDCSAGRLGVPTENRLGSRSGWVVPEGGAGLKQIKGILGMEYWDGASLAYRTENETFFLEIEIAVNNGRVQNNFEASGCEKENSGRRAGCRTGCGRTSR